MNDLKTGLVQTLLLKSNWYGCHYSVRNGGSPQYHVRYHYLTEENDLFRGHEWFGYAQRLTDEFPCLQIQRQTIVKQSILSAVFLKQFWCSIFYSLH